MDSRVAMFEKDLNNSGDCLVSSSGLDDFRPRPPSLVRSGRRSLLLDDDDSDSEKPAKSNGRPSMLHPTVVHGEITR